MMKKNVAVMVVLYMVYTSSLAFASTISHSIKDQLPISTEPFFDLDAVNRDINNLTLQGVRYLEIKDKGMQMIVGEQSNILSDGFMAGTSGMHGVRTGFKADSGSVDFLYGNNGQDIIAANVGTTFKRYNDLNIEALYFKIDNSFFGLKISSKAAKNITFSAQASKNLVTQSRAYFFMTKYGDIGAHDKMDFSISYRHVEPNAISYYSANTVFLDSKGIRLEIDYKLSGNLTLTAFQDFVHAMDKSRKNLNNLTLSWVF